jgi:hypothetical protein
MGAKRFSLFLRQPNLVGCHQDQFGRVNFVGKSDGSTKLPTCVEWDVCAIIYVALNSGATNGEAARKKDASYDIWPLPKWRPQDALSDNLPEGNTPPDLR